MEMMKSHPLDVSSSTRPRGLFMCRDRGCAVCGAEMFSLWPFLKSVWWPLSEAGPCSWGIHDQVRKRESGRWSVVVSLSQQVPTRESVSTFSGIFWVYSLARATTTKHPGLDGLHTDVCFLTVLEAGSPRSGSWQVWFLLRSLSLAGKWLPSDRVVPWLSLNLCVRYSLLKRTPVRLGQGPPLWSHVAFIISEVMGIGTSAYEFWARGLNSTHSTECC